MDSWIFADSDPLGIRVAGALRRFGIECPAARILSFDSVNSPRDVPNAIAGIVFCVSSRLRPDQIEIIKQIHHLAGPGVQIAVVSTSLDHGTMLKTVRAGASDFLNADENLENEIRGFIDRVRSDQIMHETLGRVITIVPCQAASDASLLAVNFAARVAAKKGACGLLDFHFRGADLAMLLKLEPRYSIFDVLNQSETIDESIFHQALATHSSGISLLAGPRSMMDMRTIRAPACQQIVALAQKCFPTVVINTEDIQHAEQIRALAKSNQIVLTMRLDVPSVHRTKEHIEFLVRNHVAREQIDLVALGTGYSADLPLAPIKKLLQVQNIECIPDDPEAAIMSVNLGNPLVLERPKSKTAVALRGFVDRIAGLETAKPNAVERSLVSVVKSSPLLAFNALSFCR
jgi:pilus assembly protein CpaE